ncbi:MAG: hypothetical protein CMJ18_19850 [Phycisphaeraceae bacterium]|nr:hypothetical protein [Phycisphaeraceae bacterium]
MNEATPVDLLMISAAPCWPLGDGVRLRGYYMTRALRALGIRAAMTSIEPLPDDAPDEMHEMVVPWPDVVDDAAVRQLREGWAGAGAAARRRLADYEGTDPRQIAGVHALVDRHHPKALVGIGLHSPLILRAAFRRHGIKKVWYAADELIGFHLSCLRRRARRGAGRSNGSTWGQLCQHAALETLFVRGLDGAIGVSPRDTMLLRWLAGAMETATVRNGVDLERYRPHDVPAQPRSLVFWGRLDFAPNIDAVCWFARHVWPSLRHVTPAATLRIVGAAPVSRVQALSALEGIEVVPDVEDLRPLAHQASAVILPIRSGAGIKNKLLEAAALGRPIVASHQAVAGLGAARGLPMLVCRDVGQWRVAVRRLWTDPALCRHLGAAARRWVEREFDWSRKAREMVYAINRMPCRRGEPGAIQRRPAIERVDRAEPARKAA